MLIKNGTIHNGIGSTYPGDIRIAGGCIAEVGNHLEPQANEDVFDARGMDILPGFIQAVSNWGVNGFALPPMTTTKPAPLLCRNWMPFMPLMAGRQRRSSCLPLA